MYTHLGKIERTPRPTIIEKKIYLMLAHIIFWIFTKFESRQLNPTINKSKYLGVHCRKAKLECAYTHTAVIHLSVSLLSCWPGSNYLPKIDFRCFSRVAESFLLSWIFRVDFLMSAYVFLVNIFVSLATTTLSIGFQGKSLEYVHHRVW